MTGPAEKAVLRMEMARRRAKAADSVDSGPALQALQRALQGASGPVSFYWPIRTELDPRPVMEHLAGQGVSVCLPITHGRDAPLTFRQWVPGAVLKTDGFGVSIPADADEVTPATLVVPMLGFDLKCHRLGYGAGHYDRTLAGLRAAGPVLAIGFAYADQQLDQLMPAQPTDQPLDMIVTENATISPIGA